MISVNTEGTAFSQDYLDAVDSPIVKYDMRLKRDGGGFVDCKIVRATVQMGADVGDDVNGAGLPIGGVYTNSMEAVLAECDESLEGVTLHVHVGVVTSEHEYGEYVARTLEYADIGSFLVVRSVVQPMVAGGQVTISCIGSAISALESELGDGLRGMAGTPADIVSRIGQHCGVTVELSPQLPNKSKWLWVGTYDATADDPVVTGRMAIAALAANLGGYAYETSGGVMRVASLENYGPDVLMIEGEKLTRPPEVSADAYRIGGLTVVSASDGESFYQRSDWSDDCVVVEPTVEVAHAQETGTDTATSQTYKMAWDNVRNITWHTGTFTVSTLDPRLTPGDWVLAYLDDPGIYPLIPARCISATFDGGWFGTVTSPAVSVYSDVGTPGGSGGGGGGGGGGGTSNYNSLSNKPRIEGVTLSGDKTFPDLGIFIDPTEQYPASDDYALTNLEIDTLWNAST